MTRSFLAIAAVGVALLAACGGGSTLSEAEWAVAMCRISEDIDQAMAAVDDGVDPRSLSLEERIERGQRLYFPTIAAFRAAAEQMGELTPPSGARHYHEALADEMEQVSDALAATWRYLQTVCTYGDEPKVGQWALPEELK